ncbi:MAG: STT3 domain-containing protein [Candidatus Hodarchaeota archaeon]
MVKIVASLRNFRDRIRTSISIKTQNVLFFFAIFLVIFLAILLRISPIIRGPRLIKAFDPWIQWYNAEYLSEHSLYEYFSWHDFKSWYPNGFYRGTLRPGLTFTVVIIYKILTFFGIPISLYDICYFFPAVMGGLTVLVIYFLGKEILDRGTGLIAAFFLAFNPGYMQRTMVGFFDNETIGVFASLLTFLFLLKAIRTGRFLYSILSGLSLGYLSLSWGGYQFVYLIIPLLCIILILIDKYNENILISYAVVEGTGLLIFSLYTGFRYDALFSDLETGGIFLFTIILIIFHIIQTKRVEHPSLYKSILNAVKWGFIPVFLIGAIIIWTAPDLLPFGFGAKFQTILNPLFRDEISLVASVAEQMPSPWSVFYYNTLIPLVLTPLGVYFCFKVLNAPEIFLITFVILMFYFTGSMIRIILIFSPAVSLMGAYGLVSVLKIFGSFLGDRREGISRKRKRQLKGTIGNSEILAIFMIVGFLGVAQIVHASDISIDQFSYTQISPAGVLHDWEESLMWMRSNLEGTDVVVSWWDYGYWLTPIGNVTTVNDNATMNSTRIGLTGMALMQTNEIYSAKAFRRLKADYVLVYFGLMISGLGGDEGKWPWMIRICNDNYARYKARGMEEDNWGEDFVFNESSYQDPNTGRMCPNWFNSQLVKLMFSSAPELGYYLPTNRDEVQREDIRWTYVNTINNENNPTCEGGVWKDYIPDNGLYDYNIFIPTYISSTGLVKLFKLDYTVLESSFTIQEAEVFENGYATFKLTNTGTKDLTIKSVKINGTDYDFVISNSAEINKIENGASEMVWVDIKSKGTTFQKNDVVNIDVTAESVALQGKKYEFSNATKNFFVKVPAQGAIKINKENSSIIQKDLLTTDIYLEVENYGESIEVLERFYLNEDTIENEINSNNIEYLSGSSILKPGEKADIYINDINVIDFDSVEIMGTNLYVSKIGVATPNNVSDEVLFSSTLENYSISILSEERIISPEALLAINSIKRVHIPANFNFTHGFTYENESTILKINVKNTGDIVFGIDSIYLTDSLIEVDYADFYTQSGSVLLYENQEDFIIIDATNYGNFEINDEILVCVTGSFGITGSVTSDIGYIHTVKDDPDIQIIENIDDIMTSFIYANETGKLVIKNTGDEPVTIDDIYVNSTLATNITYLSGKPSLDIQECAIVSFDIPDLMLNKSTEIIVNITTTSTATTSETFNAYVDPAYYSLVIDDDATEVDNNANMTLLFTNTGKANVTIESLYVNDTYVPLSNIYAYFNNTWVPLTSSNILAFEIGIGDTMELTIRVNDLEVITGLTINVDDEVIITIRTEEGPEIIHEEIVIP